MHCKLYVQIQRNNTPTHLHLKHTPKHRPLPHTHAHTPTHPHIQSVLLVSLPVQQGCVDRNDSCSCIDSKALISIQFTIPGRYRVQHVVIDTNILIRSRHLNHTVTLRV